MGTEKSVLMQYILWKTVCFSFFSLSKTLQVGFCCPCMPRERQTHHALAPSSPLVQAGCVRATGASKEPSKETADRTIPPKVRKGLPKQHAPEIPTDKSSRQCWQQEFPEDVGDGRRQEALAGMEGLQNPHAKNEASLGGLLHLRAAWG